jgi:hypothetical protein
MDKLIASIIDCTTACVKILPIFVDETHLYMSGHNHYRFLGCMQQLASRANTDNHSSPRYPNSLSHHRLVSSHRYAYIFYHPDLAIHPGPEAGSWRFTLH